MIERLQSQQVKVKELADMEDTPELKALMGLATGYLPPEHLTPLIGRYARDPDWTMFGAYFSSRMVGLLGLREHRQNIFQIQHLAVKSDYQSQGIGRALIHECFLRFPVEQLFVKADSETAGFYVKNGFELLSVEPNDWGVQVYLFSLKKQ